MADVFRLMALRTCMLTFWRVVIRPVVLARALFGALLPAVCLVSVRVALVRRAPVLLLMFVPVLLLGIVPFLVTMLCDGGGRSEEEAQHRCTNDCCYFHNEYPMSPPV